MIAKEGLWVFLRVFEFWWYLLCSSNHKDTKKHQVGCGETQGNRSMRRLRGACLLLSLTLIQCAPADIVRPERSETRLLLANFRVVGHPEFPPRSLPVTRRGKRRDAIMLIAPSTVKLTLAGISGPIRLKGWAAPVFNIGDGIQMEMKLTDSQQQRTVYSRRFDAARNAADRDWIPLDIGFNLDESSKWDLEMTVSAGPQGDLVGDWVALAELHLLSRSSSQ
jgi:hypothetical protein